MVDAVRVRIIHQHLLDNSAQLHGGETSVDGISETLYRPFLSKKPVQKTFVTRELPADDRAPQGQTVLIMNLTEILRLAIEIFGVRGVCLQIISLSTAEHAVGTQMHQARTDPLAQNGHAVRQQRVDFKAWETLLGHRPLLDDANAIDHNRRPKMGQNLYQTIK
ncbi:MAG: hypothetical protein L6290_12930 [Thermodesulfovibrionales bacterium]|nr:hypothetical protein [Thermodesulfovibrionales bacterium]